MDIIGESRSAGRVSMLERGLILLAAVVLVGFR